MTTEQVSVFMEERKWDYRGARIKLVGFLAMLTP